TINAQTLGLCKDGVKVLNYARGELVNNAAILDALESGKVSAYMTDFAAEELLGKPGVICTPHLGASTPEAEDNCAIMAAQELSDYLRNGNITHSVNMPDVQQPRAGGRRICVIHRNEPGVISQITALTTAAGLDIENMVNKSTKDMAYTMLDVTGTTDGTLKGKPAGIPAVIRVRILYSIPPPNVNSPRLSQVEGRGLFFGLYSRLISLAYSSSSSRSRKGVLTPMRSR